MTKDDRKRNSVYPVITGEEAYPGGLWETEDDPGSPGETQDEAYPGSPWETQDEAYPGSPGETQDEAYPGSPGETQDNAYPGSPGETLDNACFGGLAETEDEAEPSWPAGTGDGPGKRAYDRKTGETTASQVQRRHWLRLLRDLLPYLTMTLAVLAVSLLLLGWKEARLRKEQARLVEQYGEYDWDEE